MEFVDSIAAGRAGTATSPVRPSGHVAVARSAQSVQSIQPAVSSAPADPRAAEARRYEGGQLVWRVQCGDLIDRERCVTVVVENNQVVLVSPPGETARLSAGQLGQLRAALNEAAKLAER
ncbi:hypothetical protein HUW46_03765 [Amycolatopsis sp. CA-230715]|nr:hypothetical protein [Amycolatopsis sp. CA-230715]QWF80345.1 hypothetical protein HUW46_03765 [Amycolatopsis sp. CA-230715]